MSLPPCQRVLVFRALMLGDVLCATPALRALRAGLPGAHISFVGLPWARELMERLPSVDAFIEFPGWPGLPERPLLDASSLPPFLEQVQALQLDLALQLHGSGAIVNPLVSSFGARVTAGFANAAAWVPPAHAAMYTRWPERGSEVERLLALTDHLGLPRRGTGLDFPLHDADRDEAQRLLGAQAGGRYAIVHAGSQLPSRRWPAPRFAAVADALADQGLAVLLTGSAAEAPLTAEVAGHMHHPVLDLTGRTSLWTLGALVEKAAVVVCNDTGISHIAAALGSASVVVANGSDVLRWAPADGDRHRVLWHDIHCRPCGHPVCPIGQACALAVEVAPVRDAALAALQETFHG